MTFEDAVWIGLGVRVPLAKVESFTDNHWVKVYARKPYCQVGEWVTALILSDERDAHEQADRWQAKLEHNPYATIAWDMKENRL